MSVQNRKVDFAHTEPFQGEYVGPFPVPDFPLRRSVRMTVYIEYNATAGYGQAWQDGVAMFAVARVANVTALKRAHWGLYATPL